MLFDEFDKTFAKSKDVNLKTVFSVANGKKVYGSETSSNVYEYNLDTLKVKK